MAAVSIDASSSVDVAAIAAAVAAALTIPSTGDIETACTAALDGYGTATVESLSTLPTASEIAAAVDAPTAAEIATAVAAPSASTIASAVAALTVPNLIRVEATDVNAPLTAITIAGVVGQTIKIYAISVYSGAGGVFSHSGSSLQGDISAQQRALKVGATPIYTRPVGTSFTLTCDEGSISAEVWYTQG